MPEQSAPLTPGPHTPEDQSPEDRSPGLFPRPLLAEVSAYLHRHQGEWEALGIAQVQVFGSVARGEAQEGSDVDVLVRFAAPAGLLAQVRAIWLFEGLLGRRTDVVTAGGLKGPLRETVLRDATDVLYPAPAAQLAGSPKRWRWRVQELAAVLERLGTLSRGLDLYAFQGDQTVQEAALMNLLRLGEGTKFVPQELQDAHPEVPWAELRGARNLIAHDYFGLDPALVWHTLTADLPPVLVALKAVLALYPES